jgi:DNA-binding MarR family transcriptional regulator
LPDLPELDPIIHGKVRLALLSILTTVDEAEFTFLRDRTGSTDGNLGAHLLKLEQAGYVAVKKTFLARKPSSTYRITEKGRKAFATYVSNLKRLLNTGLA